MFLSNYHGQRCDADGGSGYSCVVSPAEAFGRANAGGTTSALRGVETTGGSAENISTAVRMAEAADAVMLFVGIDTSVENEGRDRYDCALPGHQPQLVSAVAALRKPTVLVLVHGGALCLGALKEEVPAILDAFYLGESGARAIAAVVFGDANPSGKLPVTMYPPRFMQQLPITQMSVSAPPGRTHLYYRATPEFAFGHGLSYSTWALQVEPASAQIVLGHRAAPERARTLQSPQNTSASFAVRLTNVGGMAGRQRVLAFARPRGSAVRHGAPRQRLWGYAGVALGVGESATLVFNLEASMLAVGNARGDREVLPGTYDIRFSDGATEIHAQLVLNGETWVVEADSLGAFATSAMQAGAMSAIFERGSLDDGRGRAWFLVRSIIPAAIAPAAFLLSLMDITLPAGILVALVLALAALCRCRSRVERAGRVNLSWHALAVLGLATERRRGQDGDVELEVLRESAF